MPASALAKDFIVNSSADPGDGACEKEECTLREAIEEANANGQSDTITFDLDEDDRVIRLDGTALTIANEVDGPDLTIDGDVDGNGTPDITVDAQDSSRVFFIASGAEATLRGLVITGGSVGPFGDGGGIENDGGTVTITSSTIIGNSADFGGGISNREGGTLTVEGSTISGNSATVSGAGIRNKFGGTLTVTNSTISGNSATVSGGGIDNSSGTLTVANSTISGNSATDSGGGIRNFGQIEIKSTIVAGNTATTGADCSGLVGFGTITSLGFNLESGTSCGFEADGDEQGVDVADVLVTDANGDPLLADNGGPTQTIALLDTDDNPAIDAIPGADCTDVDDMLVDTDQRGVERPQGEACDIGAFELVQDASVTIADVIELFDEAVAAGTLTGAGPGNSAAGRLNALRNMLLTAGELLEQGEIGAACTQLQAAAERTDGASPPPDFVQGAAAGDLHDKITAVQDELGCLD